eukprot:7772072-Pyramimonas_sp.AAC.1
MRPRHPAQQVVSPLDPEDILGDIYDELGDARWPRDVGPQVLRERQRIVESAARPTARKA